MISYHDITRSFSFVLKGKRCIKTEFSVRAYAKYRSCRMEKIPNSVDQEKELYRHGYDNLQDFSSAPVGRANPRSKERMRKPLSNGGTTGRRASPCSDVKSWVCERKYKKCAEKTQKVSRRNRPPPVLTAQELLYGGYL